MRGWLVFMVAMGLAVPAAGQTCTPTPVYAFTWGSPGMAQVPDTADEFLNIVPAGEVWVIKAGGAGLDIYPGVDIDWRLQVHHLVPTGGYWLFPLEIAENRRATPTIALSRPVILEPGERISVRVDTLPSNISIFVNYSGWSFPEACLASLLVPAASAAAPDLTAFLMAVESAALALEAIPGTVP